MRLIDADALIAEWCDGCKYLDNGLCDQDICGGVLLMKEAPIIEAEPIRHAKWEKAKYIEAPVYVCPECGNREPLQRKFCPECGCMMEAC